MAITIRKAERVARTVIATLAAATVLGAQVTMPQPAAASKSCPIKDQVVARSDGWAAIATPRFSSGPQEINMHSKAPYAISWDDPSLIFVTNGDIVMRSTDAGCRFKEVLDARDVTGDPPPFARRRVDHIVIARKWVYVVLGNGTFIVSDDRGETWVENIPSNSQLLHGSPIKLVVAPSDPSILYALTYDLTICGPGGCNTFVKLWVSRDHGASWQIVFPSPSALQENYPSRFDIAVDPLNPERVWLAGVSTKGLLQSDDGGTSWNLLKGKVRGTRVWVAVHHRRGEPIGLVIFSCGVSCVAIVSLNGGQKWAVLRAPHGQVDSVAYGGNIYDVAYSSAPDTPFLNSAVFHLDIKRGGWSPLTPYQVQELRSDKTGHIYGLAGLSSGRSLVRYDGLRSGKGI